MTTNHLFCHRQPHDKTHVEPLALSYSLRNPLLTHLAYTFAVNAVDVWPMAADTADNCIPLLSRSIANAWRTEWGLKYVTPATLHRRRITWRTALVVICPTGLRWPSAAKNSHSPRKAGRLNR